MTAIIQGPDWGWRTPGTLGLFAVSLVVGVVFVTWERRREHPMLQVRLFRNMRFTAASGAVTFAFFALFGFIFLITQYFQFVRGYGPLESGVRVIPVAVSIAVSSVLGTRLAVRFGNKAVVTGGLLAMSAAFAWISQVGATTSYVVIVGQMILLGLGLGATTAPATEAIMGAVPPEQAGQGSAVNDATREVGGTLGVAVIGSVFASVYATALAGAAGWSLLPPEAQARAADGVGLALAVVQQVAPQVGPEAAAALSTGAVDAFMDGLQAGCLVAAAVTVVGAAVAGLFLPARPRMPSTAPAAHPRVTVAGGAVG